MEYTTYGTVPKMKQEASDSRAALSQLIAVNANNILLFSNGMVASYPTILIPGILADKGSNIILEDTQISWIGSISFVTALIACILSGVITNPVGRTKPIQIASLFLFGFWLIFNFATEIWHIYIALCLCGFSNSMIEAPILSYKAEVCQPHLRGILSATSTLSVIFGVLVQFILGSFFHWRTLALVSSSFPFIAFFILIFIPESPKWLIMHKKIDKAHQNLAWLRGWTTLENVEEEFQGLLKNDVNTSLYESFKEDDINTYDKRSKWKQTLEMYTRKSFLWPFGLVSFIYVLANVTGLCTLQTYAVNIFSSLQAPMDKYYATIILGVTEVIGCIVSLFFVRYFGKRVMGCVSILGVGVCNVIIGIYAFTIDIKYFSFENEMVDIKSNAYAWVPLCVLISMAFIGHAGIRVLPWILLAEVFSHETRAVGCGLGSATYYLLAFLANKIFLSMSSILQISGTYWFYACVCVIGFIIMYFFLPETEGKELDKIIDHFAGISKLDNKVRKRSTVSKADKKSCSIVETAVD